MDEATKALLEEAGVDIPKALRQTLNKEERLLNYLVRFAKEDHFSKYAEAAEADDAYQAWFELHNVKGVSANLAIERLYALSKNVCDMLKEEVGRREEDPPSRTDLRNIQGLADEMTALKNEYDAVIERLRQLGGSRTPT